MYAHVVYCSLQDCVQPLRLIGLRTPWQKPRITVLITDNENLLSLRLLQVCSSALHPHRTALPRFNGPNVPGPFGSLAPSVCFGHRHGTPHRPQQWPRNEAGTSLFSVFPGSIA